jgi:hypothetical protein
MLLQFAHENFHVAGVAALACFVRADVAPLAAFRQTPVD